MSVPTFEYSATAFVKALMTRRHALAAAAGMLVLALASTSAAEEARGPDPEASVRWAPGRIEPADPDGARDWAHQAPGDERAPAPLEAYESAIEQEKPMTKRSRALAGFLGVLGAGTLTPLGVASWKHDRGLSVFFLGVGASCLGLAVGAIVAPTRGGIEEDLSRARQSLARGDAALSELERSFARAASRERAVRKITSAIVVAGGGAAVVGAVMQASEHRSAHSGASFLGLAASLTTIGVYDFVQPWEIETRYETARAKAIDVKLGAVPTRGGAVLSFSGTF